MFADYITGNLIRGSILQSIATSKRPERYGDPVSYWDLDNGRIVSESADIYGDLYVDSKKYSYRRYNVAEWLDKVEEIAKKADQASREAKTAASNAASAASSAASAASSAQSSASSAQQTANAASTTANNAYSAARSAQSAANSANSAAGSAQAAANSANNAISTFLEPAINEFGHATSRIRKIWVVNYGGTYYLEVQPEGYYGSTSWSTKLDRVSI